jgi:hypothetical protein
MTRKPKNPYYVGSKIPADVFRLIVFFFIKGQSPAEVANILIERAPVRYEITAKSLSRIFHLLRMHLYSDKQILRLIGLALNLHIVEPAKTFATYSLSRYPLGDHPLFTGGDLHHCLYVCGYGPSLKDVLSERSAFDDEEEENIFKWQERFMIFAQRIKNRKKCKTCKMPWLQSGSPKLWQDLAEYLKHYKNIAANDFPYYVYSALLAHIIEFGLSLEKQRRLLMLKAWADATSSEPSKADEERLSKEDDTEALVCQLKLLYLFLQYLELRPIRN